MEGFRFPDDDSSSLLLTSHLSAAEAVGEEKSGSACVTWTCWVLRVHMVGGHRCYQPSVRLMVPFLIAAGHILRQDTDTAAVQQQVV